MKNTTYNMYIRYSIASELFRRMKLYMKIIKKVYININEICSI